MTDLAELAKVQKHWPIAEFGVLTSYNAAGNGNRFPGKERIDELARLNLNLSLHVCGKATAVARLHRSLAKSRLSNPSLS